MERNVANEMLTTIQESQSFILKAIAELEGACPEETWSACAKLVGRTATDMFDYVMSPIFDEYPDLAPDWYREGTPMPNYVRNLNLLTKAPDTLLSAFEAAYEKAQSAIGLLSQISDPLELAVYSHGIHQACSQLCNARVVLLYAAMESKNHGSQQA